MINSSLLKQPLPQSQRNSYTASECIEPVYMLFFCKGLRYDRKQKRATDTQLQAEVGKHHLYSKGAFQQRH